MTKKRNLSRGLKGLSVILIGASLLPLTPIYADEAVEEELKNSRPAQTASMKTGWSKEGARWYYYDEKGVMLTGWQDVGSQRYYMNADGIMQTGWNRIDNNWYYMNASGAMKTEWNKIGGEQYYLGNDGVMETGYSVINGRNYFFKPNGALDSNLEDLNQNPTPQEFIETASSYAKIIAQENGLYASVITAQAYLETGYGRSALSKAPNHNLFGIKGTYNGEFVNVYTKEDDGKGNLTTIKADFRKYPSYRESYEDYAEKMVNGVSWNKEIYTGTWKANTNNYTDATAALTGVYATDISYYTKLNRIIKDFNLYELDGDTLVTNPSLPKGWQKVGDNWYYIGKNGYKHTGWQIIDKKSYYMDSNGVMQTGWVSSGGETYYMNRGGSLRTNAWVKDNGLYYYVGSDGEMQTGWIEVKGKSYYMDNNGVMQTGWVQIDNQWYHFNASGADDISRPNAGILNEHTAKRLQGPRRVETALQVSREVYPDNSTKNVVLAGFSGEVDALTGTLLASAKDAPLLLVHRFDDIKRELVRLGVENVYLLGGNSAISQSVESELRAANYNVHRVAGSDRYDTAVEVAKISKANTDHIFLTNDGLSGSLADALAVGSVSGRDQAPIFLTGKKELAKPTLVAIKEMKVKKITIIGGETVISEAIKKELEAENIEVERLAGGTRWETAEKVANKYFSHSKKAIVTNDGGVSFADALMGGYLGAKENAPVLLTAANKLSQNTENYLKQSATSAYILGGETVVANENFTAIEEIIKNN